MRYLVTGGAGFIGSHIVDALIDQGHEVLVIDNFSTGRRENLNAMATLLEHDIEQALPDLGQIDGVFHLAARARIQPSIQDPAASCRSNVLGSINVFKYAADHNIPVVHSSSSSVYGVVEKIPETGVREDYPLNPRSPYALQKLECEQYLALFKELYGLKYVALRYFNVFGERQIANGAYATVIGTFFDQKKNDQPLTIVGDGEQRRDFTYVKDVVEANIDSMAALQRSESWNVPPILNIGTGVNYSVNQIAQGVWPEGKYANIPPRPGEAQITLANNTQALALLGWKPSTSVIDWLAGQQ